MQLGCLFRLGLCQTWAPQEQSLHVWDPTVPSLALLLLSLLPLTPEPTLPMLPSQHHPPFSTAPCLRHQQPCTNLPQDYSMGGEGQELWQLQQWSRVSLF